MRRLTTRTSVMTGIGAVAMLVGALLSAEAQSAPGLAVGPADQGRNCQTIRTCNFARTASVRGCLSSYTCRTCRFVLSKCAVGNAEGACQRMRCSWGG